MKRLIALLALVVGAATLVACTPTPDNRPVVLVYGDSLTVMSEQAATQANPGYHLVFRAQGGTAPCDWAPGAFNDRLIYKPVKVVIAFTGNMDICTIGGPFTTLMSLAAFLANYDQNMIQFSQAFQGLPVSVMGPPAMHDNIGYFPYNGNPGLIAQYQSECNQFGWHYDSLADAQLTPGHVFRYAIDGVTVRTSDGVHLTPAGQSIFGADLLR